MWHLYSRFFFDCESLQCPLSRSALLALRGKSATCRCSPPCHQAAALRPAPTSFLLKKKNDFIRKYVGVKKVFPFFLHSRPSVSACCVFSHQHDVYVGQPRTRNTLDHRGGTHWRMVASTKRKKKFCRRSESVVPSDQCHISRTNCVLVATPSVCVGARLRPRIRGASLGPSQRRSSFLGAFRFQLHYHILLLFLFFSSFLIIILTSGQTIT